MNFLPEKVDGFNGEYPARVENIEGDPKNAKRVQVRVLNLFTDNVPVKALPWATYKLPIGARQNNGSFIPVQVGDMVWVDFPFNGDTRRPRITGSVHMWPDGELDLPHETFGGSESYEHQRSGSEPVPDPVNPQTDLVFTHHNVMVEICEDNSVRVTQKTTGTGIEITKDGHITLHCSNDVFLSAVNVTAEVEQNVTVTAAGGKADITSKTCTVTSEDTTLTGGKVNMKGAVSPTGSGSLCGIPYCLFTGAAHVGPTSTGN